MSNRSYDVVVVGAGPAGASAARSAAFSGMRVLMVERKTAVGIPVRCAEYIPAPLLGELNIGHEFVVQRVRGMKTYLPDGSEKTTPTPGLMIRRDLFDQTLCKIAQTAGAELMRGASALSSDGRELRLKTSAGAHVRVGFRILIGADGPHSKVGKWMGSSNHHLIAAIQVRVPLVEPLDHTQVYFRKEFHGGYGWLFPKNGDANVGLGILKQQNDPALLRKILSGFLEFLSQKRKIVNRPLGCTLGWIPAGPLRRIVSSQYALAGDAAGQAHPITGAGVFQAVSAGKMAGFWAATAIQEGDLSLLAKYEEEWKDLFGESHERGYRRRLLLEQHWDRLDQIIKRCWVAFREHYQD